MLANSKEIIHGITPVIIMFVCVRQAGCVMEACFCVNFLVRMITKESLACRASGCHLDTETLKIHPSELPKIFCEDFFLNVNFNRIIDFSPKCNSL